MRARSRSFAAFGAWLGREVTLSGGERARQLAGRRVTAGLFELLGVRPALGRSFQPGDDLPGAPAVAIVSHRFWRQQLGGSPAALGSKLRIDDEETTVVGVLPAEFSLGRPEDVYRPLGPLVGPGSYRLERQNHTGILAVARLRDGVTVEAARAELQTIAGQLALEHPRTNAGNSADLEPLRDVLVGEVRPMLWILLAAVATLLLAAAANLASLFLARALERRHETALRRALGAGEGRLARQGVLESLLLSLVGGTAGVALAALGLRLAVGLLPASFPRLHAVALDGRVLAVSLLLSLLVGALLGLAPALLGRGDAVAPLLRGTRSTGDLSRGASRRLLLVAEVAFAVVLLAGAGLMARTLERLVEVDPGFRADGLLTAKFQLVGSRSEPSRVRHFLAAAEERLRALPGVEAVGFTQSLPIEGVSWDSVFVVEGLPEPPHAEVPSLSLVPVSAGYLETIGVPRIAGRGFGAEDRDGSPLTAVVSESFVRRHLGGLSPLGRRFKQGWTLDSPTPWIEIVGVVGDVRTHGLVAPASAVAYLPIDQHPDTHHALVVRTAGRPEALATAVEAALAEVDREVPLHSVQPMAALIAQDTGTRRLTLALLGGFALFALAGSAIGIFGVTAYAVAQRGREFGVRVALGALPSQLLRLALAEGTRVAAAGVLLGLAGALAAGGLLRTLLYEVRPWDPPTLAASALLLLAVAIAAGLVPALRATRVDPVRVLRSE